MKLSLLIAMTSLLALAGCGKQAHPAIAVDSPSGPPLPVSTIEAVWVEHAVIEEVVGTVRSKQQALVEAKVSGRVEQYLAVPGQKVKAGDLLVQLDAREIATRVDSARAILEQADRELARYRNLVAQNAATRQELDAVEARQKVASAQLVEAETMLDYARVTAPFDGVVTRKLAEVGDLALPGKPLAEVESPRGLRFETDLPEAILDRVSMGQKLSVRVGPVSIEATISEIAPMADAVSRTFRVKMDLPDEKGLRSGQFGRVAVPVAEGRALVVPSGAVVRRGQLEAVFVVTEGRAWLRLVKTGRILEDGVELLSGVEPGEFVVREASPRFADGQTVEVKS